MDYVFKKSSANANDTILTLERFKQELRIDNTNEDIKLQSIIDFVIAYFQRMTGYIFRVGTLDLTFSYKDNINYDRRKIRTYASIIENNKNSEYNDFYSAPLGANIATQKPSKLSFKYDIGEKEKVLSPDEIANLLPDNFFISLSKFPLQFKLPRDLNKLQDEVNFDRYNLNNSITCTLNVSAIDIPDDVKGCILRIASALYENPDLDVSFSKDMIVQSTLDNYNFTAGL